MKSLVELINRMIDSVWSWSNYVESVVDPT
jgi:hypothetical protein